MRRMEIWPLGLLLGRSLRGELHWLSWSVQFFTRLTCWKLEISLETCVKTTPNKNRKTLKKLQTFKFPNPTVWKCKGSKYMIQHDQLYQNKTHLSVLHYLLKRNFQANFAPNLNSQKRFTKNTQKKEKNNIWCWKFFHNFRTKFLLNPQALIIS
jgi:hypothetical protein